MAYESICFLGVIFVFSRILFFILCSFQVIADQPASHAITGHAENLFALKQLNKTKINLLLKLEQSKQAELRLLKHPKQHPSGHQPKMYKLDQWPLTANSSNINFYEINHTYPLRLSSDNGRKYLDFHGLVELDQDIFYNINGLGVYTGLSVRNMYNQNTLDRLWANHIAPSLLARLDDQVIFNYAPDFGLNQYRTFDAFVEVNYSRPLSLKIGLQKDIVGGLELLLPGGHNELMYGGFPGMLAPNREIGFYVYGALGAHRQTADNDLYDYGFNDAISYQFGMVEGAADNTNPGIIPTVSVDSIFVTSIPGVALNNKSIEARVFFNPFINDNISLLQNLGFGLSGSFVNVNNQSNMPALLSMGLNPIFVYSIFTWANGPRTRVRPQILWYYDSLEINADWVRSSQHLQFAPPVKNKFVPQIYQQNKAGQIQVAYNLTHEKFSLDAFKPNNNFHPFEPGAYGALQIICRVSNLSIDPASFYSIVTGRFSDSASNPMTSVQQANAMSVGLHWYWNDYFSLQMEYDQSNYVGGCSTGALDPQTNKNPGCFTGTPGGRVINRPSEKVFMQRMRLVF